MVTSTQPPKLPFAPGESPFHAKGMLWMGIRAFFDARVPGGVQSVTKELSAPFSDFLTQSFVPPAWYDILPVLTIAGAAAAALGVDRKEYVKQSAEWHAEQDMNGVYKALLSLRSPAAVCKRFGSLHQQIYDFGKAEMLREEANRVESLAQGLPEPLAWWWKRASEAYVLTVLRAAGAKSPRMVWQSNQPDGTRDGISLVRIASHTMWA